MTDPISDMLTRLRNANLAKHQRVRIPASKIKLEIARLLKEEGYISDFTMASDTPHPTIEIQLKYSPRGERVIHGLERVSRPGRRVYVSVEEIPKVLGGLGICILSTSRGIMTGKQAKAAHVGGEFLCNVW